VVDECLAHLWKPGMSAEALWKAYRGFGDDPFIVGGKWRPAITPKNVQRK
jgi:hypothetical protein